jgi:enamine deaminase RidA (YjgF/YER057c/UK114 family)
MPLDRRQPEKYKARANLYAQVIESTGSRMIHIAGTVPMDENNVPFTGSIREQTQLVWKNIGISLDEFGAKPSDIVRINQFTTDIDAYLADGIDELGKFFGEDRPTSTLVEVTRLVHPDWKIEIEATAVLDD